jgi:hypothetical protein
MPGKYTVRLNVGGKVFEQPLMIKMDPRVTTPAEGLEERYSLSMQCYDGVNEIQATLTSMRAVRKQLDNLRAKKVGDLTTAIDAVEEKIAAIEGPAAGGRRGMAPPRGEASLGRVSGELSRLLNDLQAADATPTTQATSATTAARKELSELLSKWTVVREKDLADLNAKLKAADLPLIDTTGK